MCIMNYNMCIMNYNKQYSKTLNAFLASYPSLDKSASRTSEGNKTTDGCYNFIIILLECIFSTLFFVD